MLHKNISVAVKIVALKSVATLHFHVIFLFCDRFHWRRSFSFWCITSWSLTRIVNGIIIRSTWGSYTWYKWQLGRRGLKTLFKDLHQGEMNMNSETIYVRTTTQTNPRTDPIQFVVPILNGVCLESRLSMVICSEFHTWQYIVSDHPYFIPMIHSQGWQGGLGRNPLPSLFIAYEP